MIRFNIIGTGFLDFEDKGGISFKTENQFFRFSDISLGRSVEFSVPATDRNRLMLGFGEDPAESGTMLRANHQCQMVYDGGEMMGTLSVTAYEGNAFKCVFYMDVAPWIATMQSLKLSDCPTSFNKGDIVWGNTPAIDANLADPAFVVQILRYENGYNVQPSGWQLCPSVNIKEFLANIFLNLGIPFSSTLSDKYWMVAGSMSGGGEDSVTFSATGTLSVGITQTQGYFSVVDIDIEYARAVLFGALVGGGSVPTKGFKATQDVDVTFSQLVQKPLFLVKWNSKLKLCKVLGGSGRAPIAGIEPLDGRTINVKKGDVLFFAENAIVSVDSGGTLYGWKDIAYPMNETTTVSRSEELTYGETWYIRNNMPDMTLFEFLKSVALAVGLELKIDANGVTLSNGSYGTDIIPLDNVVSVDRVERIVDAWGKDTKRAFVDFDSEDYVTDKIIVGYDIDNQTRQGESSHTSKFSEGNVGTNGILIQDVEVTNNVAKFKAKKWTIAYVDDASTYLQRIQLPDAVGYDDIAINSTCMIARMATGEASLFALIPQTVFIWRGSALIWTDANWSGGIMTLTLQRVSQAYAGASPTPPPPQPFDAKVEYLESDGTQWIDTGIVLQENDVVEIEAMFLNKSGDNFIMGASGLSGEGSTWIEVYGNSTHYVRFGSSSSASQSGNASANMNVWRTYKIEKGKFYVDGVQKLTPNYASMPSRSLVIFGRNSSTLTGGIAKIRAAKILRDGAPILDLSAVRAGSVGYMYDTVSDALMPNNGVFAYGNDV